MNNRIHNAFAEIHADKDLIDNTMAYLRDESEKRKGTAIRLPVRAGAVAAMVVLVFGFFIYNLYFVAVAHVNIDINPSVELSLNRLDRVIGAFAFNGDGSQILNETNLRGKTYKEAAELIFSAVETNGYVTANALVSVTVQSADSKHEQDLCFALQQFVSDTAVTSQALAEIEVFPVTSEVWSTAHSHHMSPAKYLAIQELLEVDESAAIDDYSDSSISQIRRRTQECRNSHNTAADSGGTGSDPQNEHNHGNGHGCDMEH